MLPRNPVGRVAGQYTMATEESLLSRPTTLFSVDLRSLALFRVGLGFILICDLINRARDLRAHYADWGVAPRYAINQFIDAWQVSFHLVSGRAEVMAVLFAIAGIFALMLMVGYRTRFATAMSWIFLVSLHSRNFMVLQGGDDLLRMLLFWSMFLPLGAYYSMDSALNDSNEKKPIRVFSVGSFCILAQVVIVYIFTALSKSAPEWHAAGTL